MTLFSLFFPSKNVIMHFLPAWNGQTNWLIFEDENSIFLCPVSRCKLVSNHLCHHRSLKFKKEKEKSLLKDCRIIKQLLMEIFWLTLWEHLNDQRVGVHGNLPRFLVHFITIASKFLTGVICNCHPRDTLLLTKKQNKTKQTKQKIGLAPSFSLYMPN